MSGDRKEHTQVFSAEQEALFERIVEEGKARALELIREHFEASKTENDNLEYHTRPHTEDVIQRTRLILETIQEHNPELVSRRDVLFGTLIAAFHDVVQKYDLEESGAKVKRKTHKAKNETESAEELVEFIDKVNERGHGEIFSEQDVRMVSRAMLGTVPSLSEGTVIQPNMVEWMPLVARAVALADLGSAGISGPEKYVAESFKLFLEENVDVKEKFKSSETLSDARKEYYRGRIVEWFESQKLFVEGRRSRLEKETEPIPEPSRSAVRGFFNKFDESLGAIDRKLSEIRSMSFEQLVGEIKKHTSLGMRQAKTANAASREGVMEAREARVREILARIKELRKRALEPQMPQEKREDIQEGIETLMQLLAEEVGARSRELKAALEKGGADPEKIAVLEKFLAALLAEATQEPPRL